MKITRREFMGSAAAGSVLAAGALLTGCAKSEPCPVEPSLMAPLGGDVLLANVAIPAYTDRATAHRDMDVYIADGRIKAIGRALPAGNAEVYDCKGALLLPSFADPHVHLDKTRIGGPRLVHQRTASVAQRAENERRLRKELNHDPYIYGSNLVRQMALKGTTHLRSHIDIDDSIGLSHVESILRVRETYIGYMDIQLVAFPQSGIVKSPGTAKLMEEAVNMGVDIIGGLDPQVFDNDLDGHLDAVFDIAVKTGAPMDLHLHEPGEIGLKTYKAIVERARAHGMKNNINLSHAFALGMITEAQLADILEDFIELGITVSGTGALPSEKLHKGGILYSGMSDNIQDMWSPWGNGDQLERAMMLAHNEYYRADDLLAMCFDMVTAHPAKLMGVENHGVAYIKEGAAANLTAVHAEDVVYAVLQRPERVFTMKDGRFTARDGRVYMP